MIIHNTVRCNYALLANGYFDAKSSEQLLSKGNMENQLGTSTIYKRPVWAVRGGDIAPKIRADT